jgi:large-conductance mechanosensitive channel
MDNSQFMINANYMMQQENKMLGNNSTSFTTEQPSMEQQSNSNTNTKQTQTKPLVQNLKDFLKTSSATILTSAAAMSIGLALKEVITNIVNDLFKPLIYKLILLTQINNIINSEEILATKNADIKPTPILSAIVSFILILITVYFTTNFITNGFMKQ